MERLEAAMAKARAARKATKDGEAPDHRPRQAPQPDSGRPIKDVRPEALWTALHEIPIGNALARKMRLSALMGSEFAAPYDILRTRVLRQMRAEGWKRLAVTSPNKACGKTTVSLNLALAMARQADLRVMLLDFDLRRPSLARLLGQQAGSHDLAALLAGTRDFSEHAVRFGPNLAIGLNRRPVPHSAETLLGSSTASTLDDIESRFKPDVIIFDTAPMMGNDDNLAFLGQVDCALLVAAADSTSARQVDSSERDLSGLTNVLGTVMNKCRYLDEHDGYGGEYY
ncbi:hypothetical protein U879_08600 [Defluviimonas sp. 20V17]|uniref:Chromosome partitioning ATPase, Mrp family, contains Fe-S cluster n=1 Tax=Allgaiera indica TaxID=765699 RepID=A0AAN4ZXD1_9RHOB|nr:CpsD/CapB family tyrosine-protein kinase [Allgaiera indica]KDB04105.1 hypothetical protein U879_08600 [Defluviimonas sp. 20V17]GHD98551.1 hypothetical protein GCM10008024_02520 [Allgaiera indica]SDW11192.1 Chromosome partitioning ATPase, Mrp family, contains Fe-S cluster [Allgaiera indica]